jgi:Ala-tRNA(Pro) deacylase
MDEDLAEQKALGVHPNDNTATVWLSPGDLEKFLSAKGHPARRLRL